MRLAWLFLVTLAACGGKGASVPESTPVAPNASASSTATVAAEPGTAAAAASSAPTAGSATPPASPPEPMDAALPKDLGKKVPAFAHRAVTPDKGAAVVRGAVPVPEALASQIDPSAPFFAWEQVMSPRTVLSFPKHAGLDL